jgi:hypothetical protein
VFWGGYPFHTAALNSARHGTSTMDTLVSIGTLAAYLWSAFVVITGSTGHGHGHVYFEVAAAVTVFLLAGRYAEAKAKRSAGSALRALLSLGAKEATVVRDGAEAVMVGHVIYPQLWGDLPASLQPGAYELLRDMRSEGIEYTAFDADVSDVDWAVVDGRLVGGFMNLECYGPSKASAAVIARAAGKLDRDKIAKAPIRFQELYPLSAAYSGIYANPEQHGCRVGSVVSRLDVLPDRGNVLLIVKVVRKELRDENETVRVARRDGRARAGGGRGGGVWGVRGRVARLCGRRAFAGGHAARLCARRLAARPR